jgi:hypothetical protein
MAAAGMLLTAAIIAWVAARRGGINKIKDTAYVLGVSSTSPFLIIPVETSDEDSLAQLADLRALPVLGSGIYEQQSSAERIPFATINRMSLSAEGNRDMNNFVCVSEGAEQAEPQRTPIVTDLKRCPETYVRGLVLARFQGSGRLARLWMTTSNVFNLFNRDELLRIYTDDRPEPLIQVPLVDAMSGKAGELFAPPFGAGGRFYLAWYYPVVFSSKLIVAIDRIKLSESYYHQTDVVLDPKPAPRKPAPGRLALRDQAAATLRGADRGRGETRVSSVTIGANAQVTLFELTGPATIEQTTLYLRNFHQLSNLWLKVYFDYPAALSGQTPAIDLPLLAFFGSELGPPTASSLMLGVTTDPGQPEALAQVWLALPMPLRSRATWVVTNQGNSAVQVELSVRLSAQLPHDKWGHLHTEYRDTKGPTPNPHHPLVKTVGPGRLAGVCISMEGHGMAGPEQPYHFLEGDERAFIDGKLAIAGTGTEDYFNNAFYFADGNHASPFAQATKGDPLPAGQVAACRWHIFGDAIDFGQSLEMSMEIGAADPALLDRYRSVAYIYQ